MQPIRDEASREVGGGKPPESILTLRNVGVTYVGGAVWGLRDVDLDVPQGAIVALLGANGAGKTTLVRAVTNMLSAHRGHLNSGTIAFQGSRIDGLPPERMTGLGLTQVMENRRLFASLTVEENLLAGGHIIKSRRERLAALAHVLDVFPRLAERRRQKAGYLSGGEQQMVAIGRSLMQSPKLLLLDEPSIGLAPRIVDQIADVLRTVNSTGTSILLIEQNIAVALDLASYAYVLEQGRIAVEGTTSDLRGNPHLSALYLGGSVNEDANPVAEAVIER